MHRSISLAALALAGVGITACGSPAGTSMQTASSSTSGQASGPASGPALGNGQRENAERFDRQKIRWGACEEEDINDGVVCGRLTVPVDWSKKDSRTVGLQVYRWDTADPAKTKDGTKTKDKTKAKAKARGTIVNIPPGPGDSGFMGFGELRKNLPDYDLIALDPRGIGRSGPLLCPAENALKVPLVPPTTKSGFTALKANQRTLWSKCRTQPAELKDHLDAFSNAKDLETLRRSLNIQKINLYGFSYGTLTAERYLGLFGEHVNGSLLEGVMNPALPRRDFVTTAAAGSQAVYQRFAQWCGTESGCALHRQDVASVFRKAQQQARSGALPGTFHGRPWSEATVTQYLETSLGNAQFAEAAKGLKELAEGRNPVPDGEGPGGEEEVPEEVPYADPIVCSSFDLAVKGPKDAEGDLAAARKAAPVVGYSTNAGAYTSLCVGSPAPAPGSADPVTSRSAHPTMLLSNSHDPATPKAWADAVARRLGTKAIHTVTDRVGHGGAFGSPAARQKAIDYMARANTGLTAEGRQG
ncbi:alpha/beta fold hydrolase [Streptomyces sp. NPDC048442]|uniref:alpha/beta fold hydrolase n=1 Tax=Streptomyces sp. NPDC048442 TaxID=3154823 RepID=UPI003412AC76